jgi:aspartate racemase
MTHRIIIIGGMGPQASVELHARLVQAAAVAGAKNGHEFPFITHVSVPIKEFRAAGAELQTAQSQLLRAVKDIRVTRSDKVVVACNTAHLLEPVLAKALQRPLTSLIANTVTEATQQKLHTVGLVASAHTIRSTLFEQPLADAGIRTIIPTLAQQVMINALIGRVISGSSTVADAVRLRSIIAKLKRRGAQKVILGCTELSVLHKRPTDDTIDPLQIVVPLLLGHKS